MHHLSDLITTRHGRNMTDVGQMIGLESFDHTGGVKMYEYYILRATAYYTADGVMWG